MRTGTRRSVWPTQTDVTPLMHHLMWQGNVPIDTRSTSDVQQWTRERACGSATQDCCPSGPPSALRSLPKDRGFRTSLGWCKQTQETRSLAWPAAANFASEDHKPSSGARTHQFWAGSFFRRLAGCTTPSCNVRAHRADQGGVDGQLHSSKQGKPISHDFKSSAIKGLLWRGQVQITDHDIRSDPRARLASQLHCEPTSWQQSCLRACSSMVAKSIEWSATSANKRRRRKRKTETAEKQQTKQMGLETRVETGRKRRSGNGPTLRPQKNLLNVIEPGHQFGFSEPTLHSRWNFMLSTCAPPIGLDLRRWRWTCTIRQIHPSLQTDCAVQLRRTSTKLGQPLLSETRRMKLQLPDAWLWPWGTCLPNSPSNLTAQNFGALCNPNPPSAKGNVAMSRVRCPWSWWTRRKRHRHRHKPFVMATGETPPWAQASQRATSRDSENERIKILLERQRADSRW